MTYTKLQQAVLDQLSIAEINEEAKNTLSDISNHGINGGFNGFIYYSDTVKFFDDNRTVILQSLSEEANEYDMAASDMVAQFGCLNGDDWRTEIDSVLMGIDCEDDTTIKNALAWYAGETVARQLGGE